MPDDIRPVGQWPRLLAGPIVRKVTRQTAHVWICTKMACQAKLVLRQGAGVAHDTTAAPLREGTWTGLTSIGQRMFVGLLAVDVTGLPVGATVSYDVVVKEGATERGLFRLGLLGGTAQQVGEEFDTLRSKVPLGYSPGSLPSFVLPVDHHQALRFAHASCRKPHGGGGLEPDGLRLVDDALDRTKPGFSELERPQQLILTGDQIYADDVAPGLLKALTAAGEQLLGWSEDMPLINAATTTLIDPGWRTRYLSIKGVELKEIPGEDEPDYSGSHLLRFGDWAAMYLFAWSDALWAIKMDPGPKYDLPGPPSDVNLAPIETFAGVADTLGYTLLPARAAKILEHAARLQEFSKKVAKQWEETNPKVLGYAHSVRAVRRVLANVATYMMFDDHEITDDWYLDKRLHDRMRGIGGTGAAAEVGPRMLRNGLSAYAFFQHWGNEPGDFDAGRQGARLLQMWTHTGNTCTLRTTPRAADDLLGIGATIAPIPASRQRAAFARIRWDYAIDFGAHRLVVLDTRTWRRFPTTGKLTWASLAPHQPPPKGTPATNGAAQVTAVANAWRAAGTATNQLGLRTFADLVDAYMALATDIRSSAATVQIRFTAVVDELSNLLDVIPGRLALSANAVRDPVRSLMYECINNPAGIPSLFAGASDRSAREDVLLALREAVELDFGAESTQLSRAIDALGDFVEAALRRSAAGMAFAAQRVAANCGNGLAQIVSTLPVGAPADVQAVAAVQVALGALDQLTQAVGLDRLGEAIFRDGDSRLAPGLIRKDALQFMVTDVLASVGTADSVTVVLSPAPIFGNKVVETFQRLAVLKSIAMGKAGEEELDFEAWACNMPAVGHLIEAAGALGCAIVLSGDVHYAGSSVNDARVGATSTRYLQLTSSSARNSDSKTRTLARLDDMIYNPQGQIYGIQADWPSYTEAGASLVDHLKDLARSKVEDAQEAILNGLDPQRQMENIWHWWNSSAITLDDFVAAGAAVVTAAPNTARAVITEAGWEVYSSVSTVRDFIDDPMLKVFGDFLTAGKPTRELIRAFYEDLDLNIDKAVQTTQTVIWDRRPDRLAAYSNAVPRIGAAGSPKYKMGNSWQKRTVGYANVGFVKLLTRGSDILEVQHELRFYPVDEPGRPASADAHDLDSWNPVVRRDWMGSLHRLGWYTHPADPAANGLPQ